MDNAEITLTEITLTETTPAETTLAKVAPTETTVTATDGTSLHVRRFSSDESSMNRCLIVQHGAGEYGGRYTHFAERAVEAGWDVLIPDLRGHGRSGSRRVHLHRFGEYLSDLDAIVAHFDLSPQSTGVFAHSTGALIMARHLQTRPAAFGALVMAAPLLRLTVPVPRLKRAVGRLCKVIAPGTRFRTTVCPEHTTRNIEVLARRETDPLMQSSVTAGWFFEVDAALGDVQRDAGRIDVPLLVMQGAADRIVDPTSAADWLELVTSEDRKLIMWPDHLHELLNEPEWTTIADEILNWLDARVS